MSIKTRQILDQLIHLTALRDVELLELSLLKTLSEMLGLNELLMFKLNSQQRPYQIIRYRQTKIASVQSYYEEHAHEILAIDDEKLPEAVLQAAKWVFASKKSQTLRLSDQSITVYPVLRLNTIASYIAISTEQQPPSPQEMFFVDGMLRIFHNYYALLLENQRDKLTGLLNRKTFDDSIDKIYMTLATKTPKTPTMRRGQRERRLPSNTQLFWLAMLDIDHFKQINDYYGHLYGDEVLLLLSQIMQSVFRETDLLFRFGGEEFVAIINVPDKAHAAQVFERFRETVAAYDFPQVGRVTISIGAVEIAEQVIASELIGQADQALYYAKSHGRNRLYFYEDLLADGEIHPPENRGSVDLF